MVSMGQGMCGVYRGEGEQQTISWNPRIRVRRYAIIARDDERVRSEMPDVPSCRTCPVGQPRVQLESSDDAIRYSEICGVSVAVL